MASKQVSMEARRVAKAQEAVDKLELEKKAASDNLKTAKNEFALAIRGLQIAVNDDFGGVLGLPFEKDKDLE